MFLSLRNNQNPLLLGRIEMESLDDLLNFSSDIGEEDDEEDKPRKTLLPPSTTSFKKFNGVLGQDDPSRSFHVSF